MEAKLEAALTTSRKAPPAEAAGQALHDIISAPEAVIRKISMTGDENPYSELERCFGDYQSSDREADWQAVISDLSEGQPVSGTVVTRAHYGAFVDIGVGFPACLQIIFMDEMDRETYIANEWCPVGSAVTARILKIAGRQIALEQVPFEKVKKTMHGRLIVNS